MLQWRRAVDSPRGLADRSRVSEHELLHSTTLSINAVTGAYSRVDGESGKLSGLELGAVRYLVEHRDRFVTQEELQQNVWGYAPGTVSRAADSTLLRLRRKLLVGDQEPFVKQYGQGLRWVLPIRAHETHTPAPATPAPADPVLQRLEAAWNAGLQRIAVVGPPGIGRQTTVRAWLRQHPEWAVRWDQGPWIGNSSVRVQVITEVDGPIDGSAAMVVQIRSAPDPDLPAMAVVTLALPSEAEFQERFVRLARERWGVDYAPTPHILHQVYTETQGINELIDCAIERLPWLLAGSDSVVAATSWDAQAVVDIERLPESLRWWYPRLAIFEHWFSEASAGQWFPEAPVPFSEVVQPLTRAGLLTLIPGEGAPLLAIPVPWRRALLRRSPPSPDILRRHGAWVANASFQAAHPTPIFWQEGSGALRNLLRIDDRPGLQALLPVLVQTYAFHIAVFPSEHDIDRLQTLKQRLTDPSSQFRLDLLLQFAEHPSGVAAIAQIAQQSLARAPCASTKAEAAAVAIGSRPFPGVDYTAATAALADDSAFFGHTAAILRDLATSKAALTQGRTADAEQAVGAWDSAEIPPFLQVRFWYYRMSALGVLPRHGRIRWDPHVQHAFSQETTYLSALGRALYAMQRPPWSVAAAAISADLPLLQRQANPSFHDMIRRRARCRWLIGDLAGCAADYTALMEFHVQQGDLFTQRWITMERAWLLEESPGELNHPPAGDLWLLTAMYERLIGLTPERVPPDAAIAHSPTLAALDALWRHQQGLPGGRAETVLKAADRLSTTYPDLAEVIRRRLANSSTA